MDNLLFRSGAPAGALQRVVGPDNAPLRWLSLSLVRLGPGAPSVGQATGAEEHVLDVLSGTCAIEVSLGAQHHRFERVGERTGVFDGPPAMLYVPRGASYTVTAVGGPVEVALVTAPAVSDHPVRLVRPGEAQVKTVGRGNWQRSVATSIGDEVAADRLLVGETVNPPGNWSSSPPHKHDRRGDGEVALEEVYYYRLDPPQGFGLQRVYTPADDPEPFDVTYAVRDGDVVAIPRGYHPVVAAAGYRLFYLWALAGQERKYGAWADDPDHAWVKGTP